MCVYEIIRMGFEESLWKKVLLCYCSSEFLSYVHVSTFPQCDITANKGFLFGRAFSLAPTFSLETSAQLASLNYCAS